MKYRKKKACHMEWPLPVGDVFRVVRTKTAQNRVWYIGFVDRESESTIACQGTHSLLTVKAYYNDVFAAQQERAHSPYWVEYKRRRDSARVGQRK